MLAKTAARAWCGRASFGLQGCLFGSVSSGYQRNMSFKQLDGLSVAILVTDGFEQVEMTEPRAALDAAGATTYLVSPKSGRVQGTHHGEKLDTFVVDLTLDEAASMQFDALLLPGGVANPDALRLEPKAIAFVKRFEEKPIAAICHGPWTLIDAGIAKDKRMTSWPSLKTDLTNAGAEWVDEEAVTDGMLVTSRKPDDIPKFNDAMIAMFAARAGMPVPTPR